MLLWDLVLKPEAATLCHSAPVGWAPSLFIPSSENSLVRGLTERDSLYLSQELIAGPVGQHVFTVGTFLLGERVATGARVWELMACCWPGS